MKPKDNAKNNSILNKLLFIFMILIIPHGSMTLDRKVNSPPVA